MEKSRTEEQLEISGKFEKRFETIADTKNECIILQLQNIKKQKKATDDNI